jgi:hypothetical protein
VVQKKVKNATKSTKTIRKLLKKIKGLERIIKGIDYKLSLYDDKNNYEHYYLEKRLEFLEDESITF